MFSKNDSKKADAVFDFVVRYKSENDGATPSIREIQAALDIKSTSNVNYILSGLVHRGRLILNENNRLCVPGAKWAHEIAGDEAVKLREENERIKSQLEGYEKATEEFSTAYPESVFPEITQSETAAVHAVYPGFVDRTSAAMGRHVSKSIRERALSITAEIQE